jgi:hypothetical protein
MLRFATTSEERRMMSGLSTHRRMAADPSDPEQRLPGLAALVIAAGAALGWAVVVSLAMAILIQI